VRAARQAPQHLRRVGIVGGLAEHFAVQDDFGVRAQHDGRGIAHHVQQAGAGLLARNAAHVVFGGLAGLRVFGDVDVEQAEFGTWPAGQEPAQQFATTGGFGGEIQHVAKHNPR